MPAVLAFSVMSMTSETSISILIVEDDKPLASGIAKGLKESGYACRVVTSIEAAQFDLDKELPSLVLLDLGLPDGDGKEFLEVIRKRNPALPVIITTARSEIADRVNGLEGGADDYLVKPYAFEELLARIRTQLRHFQRGLMQQKVGDLSVDLPSRTATRAGHLLDLTPREFDLMAYLVSLNGEVATRQMLQHEIWNVRSSMTSMDNVIDVHISRLRQKMEIPGAAPLLHTVRGVGFVLKEDK